MIPFRKDAYNEYTEGKQKVKNLVKLKAQKYFQAKKAYKRFMIEG